MLNHLLPGVTDGTFAQRLLDQGCAWLRDLQDCPQDPLHHGEGNVLNHVLWVCRELSGLSEFQALSADDQQILAWAALLHDVEKPSCTFTDQGGRIRSPGHAEKGAIRARSLLWQLGCPFEWREQICGLVEFHMACFWVLEREHPAQLVRRISLQCSCHHLTILAKADALGRQCQDRKNLLERIELFEELAKDHDCWDKPAEFASPLSRFRYFQNRWHNPELAPFEDFRCRTIVMSGLPGVGKDTWIQNHAPPWPVVSLDALRQSMKVRPTDSQGAVIEAAREQAREHLRAKRNFIWNATNLSQRLRQKSLSLLLDYGAEVTIVYLDAHLAELEARNSQREQSVPWNVIERMLRLWEVPWLGEAHGVEYLS